MAKTLTSIVRTFPFFAKVGLILLSAIASTAVIRSILDWSVYVGLQIFLSNVKLIVVLWLIACALYYGIQGIVYIARNRS
jgi:hypothetical protein